MLSVSVISSSAAAVSYYEKDDYYSKDGEESERQGTWFGKGAEALGLSGGVDREDFKNLLEGQLPNGTTLGVMRDGELKHTPGWDLTFSAPKSVSVMAEVGGDKRLFAAHDKAVQSALGWVEKNISSYRIKEDGAINRTPSGNLVAALFQHDTSRNQDPALHSHAVVINATERTDGKWASLDSLNFFRFKMAVGNIYRSELAKEVQRAGYQVERTHTDGRFELVGVPQGVRDFFSSRRSEIEKSMAERGIEGSRLSEQAALKTRNAKETVPRADLLPKWESQVESMGFDPQGLVPADKATPQPAPESALNPKKAVEEAINRLAENEHVFSHANLLQWSLAYTMGSGDVKTIERAIVEAKRSGSLEAVPLGDMKGWTTPRARGQEQKVLDAVKETRGAVPAIASMREVDRALKDTTLSEGQRRAVELIATAKDRFVGVVGRPGTGKTFMLDTARKIIEAKGYQVVGMAQNAEAARQLGGDANMAATTIQKHLNGLGGDLARLSKASPREAAKIRSQYSKQVWMLDEGSQVGSGLMRRLTYAADRLGARMVLVGDPKQLAAIEAGKPYVKMMNAGMKYAEIDEIRRQQDARHRSAVRAGVQGKIAQAMEKLEQDTKEIGSADARISAILDAYDSLGAEKKDTFILTAGNREKQQFNDAIRNGMRARGELPAERSHGQLGRVFSVSADRRDAAFYDKGYVVRFVGDAKTLGIKKGEYLHVAGVDKRSNTVTLHRPGKEDRPIRWNPRQVGGSGKRAVEVYHSKENTVANGETIRWTRNMPELGLTNGLKLKVIDNKDGKMRVETSDGRRVDIDTKSMAGRHWEHSYASTVYSSQGGTAKHVLVNAESYRGELFNQKAFLVAISRQKESLTLFSDDKGEFKKNVEKHLGEKTSALESTQERQTARQSLLQRLGIDWGTGGAPAPERRQERQPEPVGRGGR